MCMALWKNRMKFASELKFMRRAISAIDSSVPFRSRQARRIRSSRIQKYVFPQVIYKQVLVVQRIGN